MGIEAAIIGAGVAAAGGAVGGAAIGAGAAGDAADAQLQAARESIAFQKEYADKGFDVFSREAERARTFLRENYALAQKTLAPLQKLGLKNLQMASGFADPNSQWSQMERDVHARNLERNLAARGLTASGTEIAGLGDFEIGLARERRNIALGLAGVGANTLQTMAGLQTNLGQGLAATSTNLGQTGASLYGNAGAGIGQTLQSGAAAYGNAQIAGANALSQGIIGVGNAFQAGLAGLGQYGAFQQNQAMNQQQLNSILAALGGGGGGGGLTAPSFGGYNLGYGGNYGF